MAVFNAAKREIDLKIVYYGPAMCGKTTNVQCIHKMLAPQQRGELMSLATKDDRTLFFDFLPIELGDVRGFKTRFHIYTVPGQVYYGLTRRAVLTGADGVVFVADSQANKLQDNIESLKDLSENLRFYKKDIASFPFIFQYNKRDLANVAPVDELNAMLNMLDAPFFESSAVTGMGVVETLTGICKMVLKQMDSGTAKKKPLQPPGAVPPAAKAAAPFARSSTAPSAAAVDDAGLRIFVEEPAAPTFGRKPAPVQPHPIPSAPAAMPEQKPSLRLRPTAPAPLSFDEHIPPAAPKFEKSPAPKFDAIHAEPLPAFDAGLPDISADTGLSFDDDAELPLDETAVSEPELSFDDDFSALDIEEPALDIEEPALDIEEPALDIEEPALDIEEPALDIEEPALDIEEPALDIEEPAPDVAETSFDMEGPELSFEDDDSAFAAKSASGVPVQTVFAEDSSSFTMKEPSLQFEEPLGGEAFSPMPDHTPAVSIVACGQPLKTSDTSIKLPITIRLNKDETEYPITITISLDDMPFK